MLEKPWAIELYIGPRPLSHFAQSFDDVAQACETADRLNRTLSDHYTEMGAAWCVVHNAYYEHVPTQDDLMTQAKPLDLSVEEWLDLLSSLDANAPRPPEPDDEKSGRAWATLARKRWAGRPKPARRGYHIYVGQEAPNWPASPVKPVPLLTYRTVNGPLPVLAIYPAAPVYAADAYRLLLEGGYHAICSGQYLDGACSYWPMLLESGGEE
jgi:hypothetical protein